MLFEISSDGKPKDVVYRPAVSDRLTDECPNISHFKN